MTNITDTKNHFIETTSNRSGSPATTIESKETKIFKTASDELTNTFYARYHDLVDRVPSLVWNKQDSPKQNAELLSLLSDVKGHFEALLSSEQSYIEEKRTQIESLESLICSLEEIFLEEGESPEEIEEIRGAAIDSFSLQNRGILEKEQNKALDDVDLFSEIIDFSLQSSSLQSRIYSRLMEHERALLAANSMLSSLTQQAMQLFSKPNPLDEAQKPRLLDERDLIFITSNIPYLRELDKTFQETVLSGSSEKSNTPIANLKKIQEELNRLEQVFLKKGLITSSPESASNSASTESSINSEVEERSQLSYEKIVELETKTLSLSSEKLPANLTQKENILSYKGQLLAKLSTEKARFEKCIEEKKKYLGLLDEADKLIRANTKVAPQETLLSQDLLGHPLDGIDSSSHSSNQTNRSEDSSESYHSDNKTQKTLPQFQSLIIRVASAGSSGVSALKTGATSGLKAIYQPFSPIPTDSQVQVAKEKLLQKKADLELSQERLANLEAHLVAISHFVELDGNTLVRETLRSHQTKLEDARYILNRPFPEVRTKKELESVSRRYEKLFEICKDNLLSIETLIPEIENRMFPKTSEPVTSLEMYNRKMKSLIEKLKINKDRFQNLREITKDLFGENPEEAARLKQILDTGFNLFKKNDLPAVCIPSGTSLDLVQPQRELLHALKFLLQVESSLKPAIEKAAPKILEKCYEMKELADGLRQGFGVLLERSYDEDSEVNKFMPELNTMVHNLNLILEQGLTIDSFIRRHAQIQSAEFRIPKIQEAVAAFARENEDSKTLEAFKRHYGLDS